MFSTEQADRSLTERGRGGDILLELVRKIYLPERFHCYCLNTGPAMQRIFFQCSEQALGKIFLIGRLFGSILLHLLIHLTHEEQLANFPAGNDLNGEHQ